MWEVLHRSYPFELGSAWRGGEMVELQLNPKCWSEKMTCTLSTRVSAKPRLLGVWEGTSTV